MWPVDEVSCETAQIQECLSHHIELQLHSCSQSLGSGDPI